MRPMRQRGLTLLKTGEGQAALSTNPVILHGRGECSPCANGMVGGSLAVFDAGAPGGDA